MPRVSTVKTVASVCHRVGLDYYQSLTMATILVNIPVLSNVGRSRKNLTALTMSAVKNDGLSLVLPVCAPWSDNLLEVDNGVYPNTARLAEKLSSSLDDLRCFTDVNVILLLTDDDWYRVGPRSALTGKSLSLVEFQTALQETAIRLAEMLPDYTDTQVLLATDKIPEISNAISRCARSIRRHCLNELHNLICKLPHNRYRNNLEGLDLAAEKVAAMAVYARWAHQNNHVIVSTWEPASHYWWQMLMPLGVNAPLLHVD